MRFFKQLVLSLLGLGVIVCVISPPLVGLLIKQSISNSVTSNSNLAELKEYKRGWFSSDMIYETVISSPQALKLVADFGIPFDVIPQPLVILSKQHILHGPIFYSAIKKFKNPFGAALIDHELIIPNREKSFFAYLGLQDGVFHKGFTRVGFLGSINSHFELFHFALTLPTQDISIKMDELSMDLDEPSLRDRLHVNVVVKDLYVNSDNFEFLFPSAALMLDLEKNKQGLWSGKQAISLPAITFNQESDAPLVQNTDSLKNEPEPTFNKAPLQQEAIGPFHLQTSAKGLNGEAIQNLIQTYRDIHDQGELYGSQLKQKLFTILPHVVTTDARIKINDLNVATPYGPFIFNAQLDWPKEIFNSPNSMEELVQASTVQVSMRISIALIRQIIDALADNFFIRQLEPDESNKLGDMQAEVDFLVKQNSSAILDLISTSQMTEVDSLTLLKMLRNHADLQDYTSEVKRLLLQKKLAISATYLLDWLYTNLTNASSLYEQKREFLKENVKNLYYGELKSYITAGILLRDQDSYVFSMQRDKKGKTKINGVLKP